jgi:hypothetical protein
MHTKWRFNQMGDTLFVVDLADVMDGVVGDTLLSPVTVAPKSWYSFGVCTHEPKH